MKLLLWTRTAAAVVALAALSVQCAFAQDAPAPPAPPAQQMSANLPKEP